MKGKRTKKLLALFITAAMAVMMMGIFASAAANYDETAPEDGKKEFQFTKYLVIPESMGVPTLEFTFTIAPGTAVEGDSANGLLPIYAGNDSTKVTGTPTIADSASFSSADSTTNGLADDGIANSTEKKYASKTVTVNFANVKFKEPGVYRWIITEDAVTNGAAIDTTPRTLDVNVQDDGGSLKVKSYTMYMGNNIPAQPMNPDDTLTPKHANAASAGDKVDSFVNSYPSNNLYIGKKISGNQASKDKYFRIVATFTNVPSGTTLNVDLTNATNTKIPENVNGATVIDTADITEGGYLNPSAITFNSVTTKTIVFYLQGDQYVNIMGLPKDATYAITEGTTADPGYVKDGYTSSPANTKNFEIGTDPNKVIFTNGVTGTIVDTDIKTGFTNEKNGNIPTGVIISLSGLIVVGIIAVIGFAFFSARSKRRYEEE
ncbi:hypothetical protein SAMN06297422_10322 [Lachnospiraceae bacterium]|nr:hypothetical protein SAMN06297422_10322 [Lachnospiraceae bacterium]